MLKHMIQPSMMFISSGFEEGGRPRFALRRLELFLGMAFLLGSLSACRVLPGGGASRVGGPLSVRIVAEDLDARNLSSDIFMALCDPASLALELAIPREAGSLLNGKVKRLLGREGFARVAPYREFSIEPPSGFVVGEYLREPVRLLALTADADLQLRIVGTLWENYVAFSWVLREGAFEVWCPRLSLAEAQSALESSRRLTVGELFRMGLSQDRCIAPERHSAGRSDVAVSVPHRIAYIRGAGEPCARGRLESLLRNPTSPWAIELLTNDASLVSLDSVDSRPSRLPQVPGVEYESIDVRMLAPRWPGVEPLTDTYAIGGRPLFYFSSDGASERVLLELWRRRIPVGFDVNAVGLTVNVPGFYLRQAQDVIHKFGLKVIGFHGESSGWGRIGVRASEIPAKFLDGVPFQLGSYSGRKVLLVFVYEDAPFVRLAMTLAVDLCAALEPAPIVVYAVWAWDRDVEWVLEAMEDSSHSYGVVLLNSETSMSGLEWDKGPAALLIGENGHTVARIEGATVYYVFEQQLMNALGHEVYGDDD